MKLIRPSIKFKILLAYTMLAGPLLLLGYSNFESHKTFRHTIEQTIEQDSVLNLTAKLQRKIMDLQRNVLIYKDSASKGSATKSEKLYVSIVEIIRALKLSYLLAQKADDIARMEAHLDDYKNSFDIVRKSRQLKQKLINNFVIDLQQKMDNLTHHPSLQSENVQDIKNNINKAHQGATSYFITSDHQHTKNFNDAIKALDNQLSRFPAPHAQLTEYKKSFLKIINTQRNYTYLINVVMAGSAREILHYSDTLTQHVQNHTENNLSEISRKLNSESTQFIALSVLSLIMAILAPWYFLSLVIRPIQKITLVLKNLSEGAAIGMIPGLNRSDEIGLLAKSANVFKAKSELTSHLLRETKKSVITQKQLNHDLSEAKDLAEKSLSVKSDFLANMSHELRTPLNAVIGYTVRLLKNSQTFTDRHINSLKAIERNGKHLLAMINDILDLSKIEANKLEIRFEKVELHQLCHDVVEQMHSYSEEQGVPLIYTPPQNAELWVTTDSIRLSQILINLLSNGLKYTEQGTVTLTISHAPDSSWVELTIRDTGIGISEKDIERLFQRFEQFDSETRFEIGKGTGLGMAIVENVARLLQAQIEVNSKLGEGTEFNVRLPLNPEL